MATTRTSATTGRKACEPGRDAAPAYDAWMAEGYDWYGLSARLGKAALADTLGVLPPRGRRPR